MSCENIKPGKLIKNFKGSGERADALRRRGDAFPESEKSTGFRDARK
jgi:hypothetical protein